jgi:hypothetical protein
MRRGEQETGVFPTAGTERVSSRWRNGGVGLNGPRPNAALLVVAGSPAYFEQRGKPKTPDDLVGHDCVRIRFSSGTYVAWRFRVKRRDLEVHVEGRLGVNSVAVARQAAIDGLALVQTPPIFIAGDLAARRLVTFSTSGRQLRRQDFFFTIRAVAKCGRRSRPWWIFCARSAAACHSSHGHSTWPRQQSAAGKIRSPRKPCGIGTAFLVSSDIIAVIMRACSRSILSSGHPSDVRSSVAIGGKADVARTAHFGRD